MKNQFDNATFDCFMVTERTDDYRVKWAADALARYIHTDRASVPWIKSFIRANKKRLLSKMASGPDLSDVAMLEIATKYLRRYCQLSD